MSLRDSFLTALDEMLQAKPEVLNGTSAAEFVGRAAARAIELERSRGPAGKAAYPPGTRPAVATITREQARQRDIRAICPPGMEQVAERCIKDGLSVEDARAKLRAAWHRRCPMIENVSDEQLAQSLTN